MNLFMAIKKERILEISLIFWVHVLFSLSLYLLIPIFSYGEAIKFAFLDTL